MASHYDVLGVRSNATPAQIRRAYVAKARELHPDSRTDEAALDARAMQDVNEAWRVLREPTSRAAYDRSLRVAPDAASARPAHRSSAPIEDLDRPIPRRLAEPGDLTVAVVRAAPWVAVVVVLVAIFVFTAFANDDEQGGSDLFGQCIAIEDGDVDDVPCTEPNDGRVVGIVEQANLCSRGSLAKVVSGGQWFCLRPADED